MISLRLWPLGPSLDHRQRRAAGAKATLRHVSEILQQTMDPRQFFTDSLGTPLLDGGLASLSRSYSTAWMATVVGPPSLRLGVDIEPSNRALPGGFLSEHEEAAWSNEDSSPPRIAAACLKEACGKALGFGLLARWDVYTCAAPQKVGPASWQVEFPAFPMVRTGTAVTKDGSLVVAIAAASMRPALGEPQITSTLGWVGELDLIHSRDVVVRSSDQSKMSKTTQA